MQHIISAIHDRTGIDKGQVQAVISALKTEVTEAMVAGKDVDLGRDFGRFTTIARTSRNFHIPATGDTVAVEGRRKVRFRVSSSVLKNISA